MDATAKILGDSVGRDKVNRFVMYFCKLILASRSQSLSKESKVKLQGFITLIATTRKAWRLGKQVEYSALIKKVLKNEPDELKKLLKILKLLSYSGWALFESIGLLHSYKVIITENVKMYQTRANMCWIFGLGSSLMVNFYSYRWNAIRLAQEFKIRGILPGKGLEGVSFASNPIKALCDERNELLELLLLDLLDITVPLSSSGYLHINDSLIGFCGTLSSAITICEFT